MRKTRLSHIIVKRIIEHYVAGTPARSTALLLGINKKTSISWYHKLRCIIREKLSEYEIALSGEIEIDESYFGGKQKGKRGRGAGGKTIVFGLYKRKSYVHALTVSNTTTCTLYSIIKKKVAPQSIIYTDTYPSYNILDVSDFQHYRINHAKEFANKQNHINGIENFWNQSKRHLRRYNGIPKNHFELYLKECEFRFNYRPITNMYKVLYNWVQEAGLV